MQEAFSPQAEDPMALQLQADELYTLEESLKAQVASAFKRQRWHEHWLQSAKGIVRRKKLLKDAVFIMNQYATNVTARRRRLEIQFSGESGFDASSGEQAGVTRGFYAGAIALSDELCMHNELIFVVPHFGCHRRFLAADVATEVMALDKDGAHNLWISDPDPSGVTSIPTPRADPNSLPGLYPLPIHPSNPNFEMVCKTFRMLGRLFAAALRDGFLVPLPLSLEFIRLVQSSEDVPLPDSKKVTFVDDAMSMSGSSNESMDEADDGVEGDDDDDLILSSEDLPRPGFLGGEIYALEKHICEVSLESRSDDVRKARLQYLLIYAAAQRARESQGDERRGKESQDQATRRGLGFWREGFRGVVKV